MIHVIINFTLVPFDWDVSRNVREILCRSVISSCNSRSHGPIKFELFFKFISGREARLTSIETPNFPCITIV